MALWEILQESIGTGLADAGLTGVGGTHVGGGPPSTRRPGAARAVPARRPARRGYPEHNCSGIETCLGTSGGTLRFREQITVGAERCVDTGTLTLTPETGGDRLMFRYTGRSSDGRQWTVAGPLSRS